MHAYILHFPTHNKRLNKPSMSAKPFRNFAQSIDRIAVITYTVECWLGSGSQPASQPLSLRYYIIITGSIPWNWTTKQNFCHSERRLLRSQYALLPHSQMVCLRCVCMCMCKNECVAFHFASKQLQQQQHWTNIIIFGIIIIISWNLWVYKLSVALLFGNG